MEIVFLARRTEEPAAAAAPGGGGGGGQRLRWASEWGMPLTAEASVSPAASPAGGTALRLEVRFQLPEPLVLSDVSAWAVQAQVSALLSENLASFKALAEALASSPDTAPPRAQVSHVEVLSGGAEEAAAAAAAAAAEAAAAASSGEELAEASGADAPAAEASPPPLPLAAAGGAGYSEPAPPPLKRRAATARNAAARSTPKRNGQLGSLSPAQ